MAMGSRGLTESGTQFLSPCLREPWVPLVYIIWSENATATTSQHI